jgi:hypothetical protein
MHYEHPAELHSSQLSEQGLHYPLAGSGKFLGLQLNTHCFAPGDSCNNKPNLQVMHSEDLSPEQV